MKNIRLFGLAVITVIVLSAVLMFAGCDSSSNGDGGSQDQIPTAADFVIGNLSQTEGNVTAVTITPNNGKSSGTITIYYNSSKALPTQSGSYTVTFDVAGVTGWKAATGLSAGTLVIGPKGDGGEEGGEDSEDGENSNLNFTTISGLEAYLSKQPANTADTAYRVKLNIADEEMAALKVLLLATNKYVFLDLSGSTITDIPDNAFNIGVSPWTGCDKLTGITIPNSVTSIGDIAFNRTGITSITIPNSVTSIGDYAFSVCNSLTSINIPNSVTSIGNSAFVNCTNLTEINIDTNNSAYTSEEGVFFNKNKTSLYTYPAGKAGNYTVPNSVTSIGDGAFSSCTSLTSVTIPDSVTSIGNNAFPDCTSLTSVTIPNSVTSIGYRAFYGCTNLTSVTFLGTISLSKFYYNNAFEGDLKNKFYASDSTNGTPGTYTTTAPVNNNSEWTKQP